MKKIPYQRAAICIGLSILSSAGMANADAAKPQSSSVATKSAQVDRTSSPKNPHLLELEKRLGQVIFAAQPDTKFEFTDPNYLNAYYRDVNPYARLEKQAIHSPDSSIFHFMLRLTTPSTK